MKRIFFFSCVFIFLFSGIAFANSKISPAIDIIASEASMVKSGLPIKKELQFDTDDFDMAIGANVKEIKISALPSEKSGKLMLENLYVVENQIIKREDFSLLKFVSKNTSEDAVFRFSPNNQKYEIECTLIVLESVNLSPVASNGAGISAWTMKNTSTVGSLLGYDPDGDELKFLMVSPPSKGILTITNNSTGDFTYCAFENATGKDSFSYQVVDSMGNYSETCTVNIKIDKNEPKLTFSDVALGDICAVSHVFESGIMSGKQKEDGTFVFNANEEITREEFVVLLMKAMGAENAPRIDKTRFADDNEISKEYKGYIESAFSLGIIEGKIENDGIHFNPKEPITLAEAAVMINNILGRKSTTSLTVFKDYSEIPVWAKADIEALSEVGILKKQNGEISPNAPLTRAQVAQILSALLRQRGK